MAYSLTLNKSTVKSQAFTTAAAILAAIILPQIFHGIGIAFGLGPALGESFLPMHLPVLLAGFFAGPIVGLIAGILSPLVSFALSGMPTANLVPFLMIELAGYGLVSGMLYKSQIPLFGKLLIVQIAGRILRALAILFAVYGLGNQTMEISTIWNSVIMGLPGILLQWCLIPFLMSITGNGKKAR